MAVKGKAKVDRQRTIGKKVAPPRKISNKQPVRQIDDDDEGFGAPTLENRINRMDDVYDDIDGEKEQQYGKDSDDEEEVNMHVFERRSSDDNFENNEDTNPPSAAATTTYNDQLRQLQEQINLLQQSNTKMKRIIKKKKYDEKDGEFVVRKLVSMQKTSLIKFVKNQIFPHVKSACNELLFNKPEIVDKCFASLSIKSVADQQALREDVCCLIKYSLCQKRKYVKERLRVAFKGTIICPFCVSNKIFFLLLLTCYPSPPCSSPRRDWKVL